MIGVDMPAIRDYTTNYTTTTSGTTIAIDTPDYAQNDLLLAIIVADTGTATWSSSGWSLLGFKTSTSQLAVLYKIAGAGEASSFTFTRSVAETFNGSLIAIRDVDTTAPFGSGIATSGLISIAVNSAAGTFTRSSGSFLTDGFGIGDTIITSGFTNAGNNTTKVISNVTATVITVSSTSGLVTETSATNRLITSGVGILAAQTGADRAGHGGLQEGQVIGLRMLIRIDSHGMRRGIIMEFGKLIFIIAVVIHGCGVAALDQEAHVQAVVTVCLAGLVIIAGGHEGNIGPQALGNSQPFLAVLNGLHALIFRHDPLSKGPVQGPPELV